MEMIINKDNLNENQISEFKKKVRAILIDDDKILVANYGGVYLLPGGSIDNGETIYDAITRELQEEIGVTYIKEELEYIFTLKHFQSNYPKRDGSFINRVVKTYYFVGNYKDILFNNQSLTEKELNDKFELQLIKVDELQTIILNNITDNPRNSYFYDELTCVLGYYKTHYTRKIL